jgi:hypothetical protein
MPSNSSCCSHYVTLQTCFSHPSLGIYLFIYLFPNPTHKTKTGTAANTWDTTSTNNQRPPGPIIMIGPSERKKEGTVVRSYLLHSYMAAAVLCCAVLCCYALLCNNNNSNALQNRTGMFSLFFIQLCVLCRVTK